jgi:hypothetical protein
VEVCNGSGTAWLVATTCATGCSAGLCTGACTAGATRCNGATIEQCGADGGPPATWTPIQACATQCEGAGQCVLDGLAVTTAIDLDGVVYVKGAVHVYTGGTINSPTGNLTIYADSITVDLGGAIVAAPTGTSPSGQGESGISSPVGTHVYQVTSGGGGGYGTAGTWPPYGTNMAGGQVGQAWGNSPEAVVQPGSPGGPLQSSTDPYSPTYGYQLAAGNGGGVLRLNAPAISIAGQVTADGQSGQSGAVGGCPASGGAGSGGGVLIEGDTIAISGTISAKGATSAGLSSGCGSSQSNVYYVWGGSSGGDGRIKILSGSSLSVTGTITGLADGADSETLLPPLFVTSASHPDASRIYNDNSLALLLSWNKPWPSGAGYFVRLNTSPSSPPTATDTFLSSETTAYAPGALAAGDNYFHIVPVDAKSTIGAVESTFHVAINMAPPSISSSTHPNPTAWSPDANPDFSWTIPQGDSNVTGVYYVFDHEGSTVPTAANTFIPISQKQLLLTGVASGVWVFHVVSVDTQGYLTKTGAHYRINIGTDPGSGSLVGTVVDGSSKAISGATVSVNNGLYTQTTNAAGQYNIATMTAGTWQVSTSAAGHAAATAMATVTSGGVTTQNFVLP